MPPIPEVGPDLRTATFADDLVVHGDRVALIVGADRLTYRDLADRVAQFRRRLGTGRRLVLLEASNSTDSVIAYLAALTAGHPVLLTPGGNAAATASLTAAYDPDVVVSGRAVRQRRAGTAHTLHPDLALLLSTSGSTGAPKLVRISHQNLQANAEAIAEYLGIRATDRAATTLPMHYCYGLSVINSHLLRGAAVVLTGLSVADACFWELFRRTAATTFAAVPYTFDLLDRVGFADMQLPHLRYVTQAGGRLAPDRVRQLAELGQRNGWDLFVMYGQTEATARMAYLPPDLAAANPQAIGVAVPGGSFRLEPLPECTDPTAGELVYSGPNVMLGYAHTPADLALGRTVDELRTGDVARLTGNGLYELVGRRSGFVKILGLRIDLSRVETLLEGHGVRAACVGTDDELVVAVEGRTDPGPLRRSAAAACGLPVRAVRVCALAELPRLATGKIDRRAVRQLTDRPAPARIPTQPTGTQPTGSRPIAPAGPTDLRALYAEILDRSDVTDDSTFVSLGGDSLSFVEMSLRLEAALGHLPAGWHTTPIRDLRPTRAPRRPRLDTSVALRAVAIVLIVGSHIELLDLPGGAHVLLGVAGFNFARFHLAGGLRAQRTRRLATSIGRIVVPSVAWIALVYWLTDDYALANVFLLNEVAGAAEGAERYFWFVETLVYLLLALLVLFTVPAVARLERRWPFALPVALIAVGLLARYDLPLIDRPVHLPTPVAVFWVFALGWATAKATTSRQRWLLTAAIVATVPGYFDKPGREALVIAGLAVLVWVTRVPSLGVLNRLAGLLAASSLHIYLTHWQVYPYLERYSGVLALVASLVVGIGYALLANAVLTRLRTLRPVFAARAASRRPGHGTPREVVTR